MRPVLITGGAGFLGSHLCRVFSGHGMAVRIFDRLDPPSWTFAPKIEYVQGDLSDRSALREAVAGAGTVIHAAFASGRTDRATIRRVNIEGTAELCRQAAESGVSRLVLISSTIAARAPQRHPFLSGSALNALDAYRESRAEAERIVLDAHSSSLSTAAVRPKTFIGPGCLSAFTIVFEWIHSGRPILLMGSGQSQYQLLEIGDMAEGIRRLCDSRAGGIFYFGAEEYGTLREDLQSLIDHAATRSRIRSLPGAMARTGLRLMELAGMVPPSELHYLSASNCDSVVDISRARHELGWRPRFSNRQALRRAYDWYRSTVLAGIPAPSIHALPASHRVLQRILETVLR